MAAGAFSSAPGLRNVAFNSVVRCVGGFVAAVTGDQVGYLIGNRAGPRLFRRPDSRLFKHEYVEKGEQFFTHYGAKAIILARFVPVVRTFVPTIAGVSKMDYSTFLRFNVVGGLLWAVGATMLGFAFGNIDIVKDNFDIAVIGVVGISLLPVALEVVKHRRGRADAGGGPAD